ncbi:MAG TPA: amino acid permease, partial [Actinomycetota bacterium]|nr:amino acid permease [Actinomycetota bacterium]
AIYMTVNLACLLYYAREQRSEFNWFLHGVIPILGILAFIPAFLVAIGIGGSIFDFISPLPYPFSVVGPVVGIWYLLGIVYLIYLSARKPERLKDTARVFIEEEVAEVSAPI